MQPDLATYRTPRIGLQNLEHKARELRATCVQLAYEGKESHLKGALSCIEILVALYYGWLENFPAEPKHPKRDRFIFSKGHACSALYAVMADRGFFPRDWLSDYGKNDSSLPSHPCVHALPILECSSGSLGHGLGVGTGMSYGLKLDQCSSRVVVLLSDGECNEGSIWEAAMFAVAKRLDNLLAIVDYNGIQSIGRTDELNGGASLAEKFRAFGWGVQAVDGHNLKEILAALNQVPFESGRPSAIIAKTRAGAGVSLMEDRVLWHYRTPSEEEVKKALKELGAVPIHLQEKTSP